MREPCPHYERDLARGRPVIGVDEVGRGPLAGPVVAAAAYLPSGHGIEGLRDSKALTEKRREKLAPIILSEARIALGAVSAAEIDSLGIEPATKLAMRRAVDALGPIEGAVAIVDGNRPPDFGPLDVITEIKADASCPSVSAAAVVAKVTRDRAMIRLGQRYEAYGWHTNKGYGSAAHRAAIVEQGVTAHHRRSFLKNIAP